MTTSYDRSAAAAAYIRTKLGDKQPVARLFLVVVLEILPRMLLIPSSFLMLKFPTSQRPLLLVMLVSLSLVW